MGGDGSWMGGDGSGIGGSDGGGIAGGNVGGGDGSGISGSGNIGGGDGSGIGGSGNVGGGDGAGIGGSGNVGGGDGAGIAGSDGGGIAGSSNVGGGDGAGIAGSDGGGIAGSSNVGGGDGAGIAGSDGGGIAGSDGGGIAGADGGGIAGSDGGGIAGADGGGIAGSDGGGIGGSGNAGGVDGAGSGGVAGGDSGGAGCVPAAEICNGIDDNCDGQIDEQDAGGCTVFFKDADGDGFGADGDALCLCAAAAPYSATQGGDCDDSRGSVHPGALELCNGIDEDCNALVDDGDGVCDCVVISSAGHGYQFCVTPRTWAEAEAACQASGYHLATVENAAEQSFLSTGASLFSHDGFWIGINDRAQEGAFVWSSGLPVGYTNWQSGEPDDAGGNEDCGQINRYYPASTWSDRPCDGAQPYICRSN
jgi:hypothetical protein